MSRALFDKMIDRVLSHEGGFSEDRTDPGNWTGGRVGAGKLLGTKFGIAANTYPTLDIRNLTRKQAVEIYHRDFWLASKADRLPAAVAFSALDGAINSGARRSIQWLQQAAGVADDGLFGPRTAAAVAKADPNDLLLRYNAARLDFMTRLGSWKSHGAGWARRIAQNLLHGAADN
ncbi:MULTISPECIES: glycoside hydrolase family 108 protein [Luteimonas]|uniref:glycoside hydrolase family 108 protein n=1 Tax=Luteimonas TaxID=83614 RepID=UPI000C7E7530|nr:MULTISPECIES: glycosyl hydrolase 108 family protein [Luteimonas]